MASFNAVKLLAWNLKRPLVQRISANDLSEKLDGRKANIRGRLLLHSILAEPAVKEKIRQIYSTPDANEWANNRGQ